MTALSDSLLVVVGVLVDGVCVDGAGGRSTIRLCRLLHYGRKNLVAESNCLSHPTRREFCRSQRQIVRRRGVYWNRGTTGQTHEVSCSAPDLTAAYTCLRLPVCRMDASRRCSEWRIGVMHDRSSMIKDRIGTRTLLSDDRMVADMGEVESDYAKPSPVERVWAACKF
ncbi:hypothetical protein BC628DRAFT_145774 [Trametes gibbosa]|nr:hypothetical protein BC628DRAFT_145774 [Trametes gibbosa]